MSYAIFYFVLQNCKLKTKTEKHRKMFMFRLFGIMLYTLNSRIQKIIMKVLLIQINDYTQYSTVKKAYRVQPVVINKQRVTNGVDIYLREKTCDLV